MLRRLPGGPCLRWLWAAAWAFLGISLPGWTDEPSGKSAAVDFEKDVAPVLVRRCLECHQASVASGGLVLADAASLRKGGDSGEAVAPGDAAGSLLIERVAAGEMPPPKQGQPQTLPPAEIAILTRWVEAGAAWPENRRLDLYERTSDVRAGRDFWSLQPVARRPLPAVADRDGSHNPVDAWVAARLEREGLAPAPRADRRTLLRRLSYGLLGLPPTAEQIHEFETDAAPDAWERLVDRTLESPHFGERMARAWLDVVRYADTCGYERDQEKPFAWKYRDWVVDAFNADMPYDEFIVHQLAGDELYHDSARPACCRNGARRREQRPDRRSGRGPVVRVTSSVIRKAPGCGISWSLSSRRGSAIRKTIPAQITYRQMEYMRIGS